jgi:hypothetical protein
VSWRPAPSLNSMRFNQEDGPIRPLFLFLLIQPAEIDRQ